MVGYGSVLCPREAARRISKVTPEEVRAVAAYLMRNERLAVAAVGPTVDPDEMRKAARFV